MRTARLHEPRQQAHGTPVVGTSNLVITLRNNLGQTSTGTVKVTVTAG